MKKFILICFVFSALIIAAACGTGMNEGENYGNLLESPEGLILTPQEHEGGWGRIDCVTCHPVQNMHLANRTRDPSIDIIAIQNLINAVIETGGDPNSTCASCHGYNGVY